MTKITFNSSKKSDYSDLWLVMGFLSEQNFGGS